MIQTLEDILITLECAIVNELNPDYFEVTEQNGFIYILLSKIEYKNKMLHERLLEAQGLIEFENDEIFKAYKVIIECFDMDELTELMKAYGTGK